MADEQMERLVRLEQRIRRIQQAQSGVVEGVRNTYGADSAITTAVDVLTVRSRLVDAENTLSELQTQAGVPEPYQPPGFISRTFGSVDARLTTMEAALATLEERQAQIAASAQPAPPARTGEQGQNVTRAQAQARQVVRQQGQAASAGASSSAVATTVGVDHSHDGASVTAPTGIPGGAGGVRQV
jgi:hypothetical protein